MKIIFIYISCFAFSYGSCNQNQTNIYHSEYPCEILKNQKSFYNFYNTIKLSEDFIALDTLSKIIRKKKFLKQISTGNYLPLHFTSNGLKYYKLYKINYPVDNLISVWLKDLGTKEYNHYEWEGKALPSINYRDLAGKRYNQKTIKGKILVLNFWFINCVNCVNEMPELNKLVKQYENRKDILFLGIAFDREINLKKFLSNKSFNYAVASDTASYLAKALDITSYPTQVIVNKKGNIVKILDTYQEMETILKKEALK